MSYRFSIDTWHKDPDRERRLDMALLFGTDFDLYLELTGREILLDINERLAWCGRCGIGHLPDDPCRELDPPDTRPPHPG